MTVLGMPLSMFLVFAATLLAGSLGAIHYLVVHVLMGRPFSDEGELPAPREPGEPVAEVRRKGGGPAGD
jgi:hypothetical protein